MLALLAAAAFMAAGILTVYCPGPRGLMLSSVSVVLTAALGPASRHAWPLALALGITALAALGSGWLERSARLPGGAGPDELARTVTGQLGALTAGILLFGPLAGAGLFTAVVGRHYPCGMLDTAQYLARRVLARALRLLAVALAAALAGGYALAG